MENRKSAIAGRVLAGALLAAVLFSAAGCPQQSNSAQKPSAGKAKNRSAEAASGKTTEKPSPEKIQNKENLTTAEEAGTPGKELPVLVDNPDAHKSIIAAVRGRLIRAGDGVEVNADTLAKKKYVLLLFSGGWCPPCRVFSPKLVKYYNENKKGDNFEVIFVSADRSYAGMRKYISEENMPWLAIKFDQIAASGLMQRYRIRGVPTLIMLDENDKILPDPRQHYADEMLNVLDLYLKKLK